MVSSLKKENEVVEVVDEISEEEFMNMSDSMGKIDYEEVWKRVKGKRLSSKGLNKIVNEVRVENGMKEREWYWSEKDRVFKGWREKGREIVEKIGYFGKRKMKFYKFVE